MCGQGEVADAHDVAVGQRRRDLHRRIGVGRSVLRIIGVVAAAAQRACAGGAGTHLGAAVAREAGDAAGMVTGITRRFPECYGDITNVIDEEPGKVPIGYSIVVARHGTVFLAELGGGSP